MKNIFSLIILACIMCSCNEKNTLASSKQGKMLVDTIIYIDPVSTKKIVVIQRTQIITDTVKGVVADKIIASDSIASVVNFGIH